MTSEYHSELLCFLVSIDLNEARRAYNAETDILTSYDLNEISLCKRLVVVLDRDLFAVREVSKSTTAEVANDDYRNTCGSC